jgi:hypothetical protein
MKHLVAAVSLAVLAVPAFAAQVPFEQAELDRALPGVQPKARAASAAVRETVDYNFIAPAQ